MHRKIEKVFEKRTLIILYKYIFINKYYSINNIRQESRGFYLLTHLNLHH